MWYGDVFDDPDGEPATGEALPVGLHDLVPTLRNNEVVPLLSSLGPERFRQIYAALPTSHQVRLHTIERCIIIESTSLRSETPRNPSSLSPSLGPQRLITSFRLPSHQGG